MMVCNNNHFGKFITPITNRFFKKAKMCRVCGIKIKTDDLRCPCCNTKLAIFTREKINQRRKEIERKRI